MPDSVAPLTKPRPLRPGGHVAVLALSSPSRPDRIELAAEHLRRSGLQISIAPNTYSTLRSYLAGPDEARVAEFNRCLNDDSVDAFFFARGGYGAMRVLDRIDYDAIRRNPRPIVGYSDLTALHQAVAVRSGVATFHGPMLNKDFYEQLSPDVERWFWDVLSGSAPLVWPFEESNVLIPGRARGRLFGGCLSLTAALMGTPFDYWIDGGIWFFEDTDEPVYRIDRMLTHLRLSGRLQTVEGVMIGKLKECGNSDPEALDQLLVETFQPLGIPVLRDLPFGHFGDNLMMPIGTEAEFDSQARTFTLLEPAVDRSGRR
jgi:muramoyltetrapeptide carboxypeptidase